MENTTIEEEEILPSRVLQRRMYRNKMISTVTFSFLGVFGFTNAILTFDWVSMLSYLFTIILGLVFGVISMGETEEIWTENHYKYAKKIEYERKKQKGLEVAAAKPAKQENDSPNNTGRTTVLESLHRIDSLCSNME